MRSVETADTMSLFNITSLGDLEVATLVEHQEAFPDILHPDLYEVLGKPPEQSILFHNEMCFDLFLIRVAELFAESASNVDIDGTKMNLSLFGAAKWFRDQHPEEAEEAQLTESIARLEKWMELEVDFEFWCSEVETQFKITMSRARMIAFAGNLTKHNMLRINKLLGTLKKHLQRNGYELEGNDILSILEPFELEYRSRLLYHSSFLAEMLYDYFWAFNTIVWGRYWVNGSTNDHSKMMFPANTSDPYKDMYGSTLVFRRYTHDIFGDRRPVTTRYLKTLY